MDARAAEQFADLQELLLSQGTPIGGNDTMVAAHALSLEALLVTNNVKKFTKVPGLDICTLPTTFLHLKTGNYT